jgi:hypothetical protein
MIMLSQTPSSQVRAAPIAVSPRVPPTYSRIRVQRNGASSKFCQPLNPHNSDTKRGQVERIPFARVKDTFGSPLDHQATPKLSRDVISVLVSPPPWRIRSAHA